MPRALEIELVVPAIFLWRYYDPGIRTDLFSTGLQTDSGTFLIDPISLAPDALTSLNCVAGIIVTNDNHLRASAQFADRFRVPIYAEATTASALPGATRIDFGSPFAPGLTAIPVNGAAAGEIAIYWEADKGTMVIGDALINFEPYGFTLLPAKYCSNFKLMRASLRKLLDYSFERMVFSHGEPILSHARDRLEALLEAHP
jgi:glyoxylase-like metal-dependent hydrolase (beta-lactamase superfamily II)